MNDRELRDVLRELRSADETLAPGFDAILKRQRSKAANGAWRLGLGAAAVVAAGTIVAISARPEPARQRLVVPAEVISLSNWRPMTDALIAGPYATPVPEAPLDSAQPRTLKDSSSD